MANAATPLNSQLFVEKFDQISQTIKQEILKNEFYLFDLRFPAENYAMIASKILEAMKQYFSEINHRDSNSVSLKARILVENFYTSNLRPLQGIFQQKGLTIAMVDEDPPSPPILPMESTEKMIYEITCKTPNFTVSFNDKFRNSVPLKV